MIALVYASYIPLELHIQLYNALCHQAPLIIECVPHNQNNNYFGKCWHSQLIPIREFVNTIESKIF